MFKRWAFHPALATILIRFSDTSRPTFQTLRRVECGRSGGAKAGDPSFLFRGDLLCVPYATLDQREWIVVRHNAGSVSVLVRTRRFAAKRDVK